MKISITITQQPHKAESSEHDESSSTDPTVVSRKPLTQGVISALAMERLFSHSIKRIDALPVPQKVLACFAVSLVSGAITVVGCKLWDRCFTSHSLPVPDKRIGNNEESSTVELAAHQTTGVKDRALRTMKIMTSPSAMHTTCLYTALSPVLGYLFFKQAYPALTVASVARGLLNPEGPMAQQLPAGFFSCCAAMGAGLPLGIQATGCNLS